MAASPKERSIGLVQFLAIIAAIVFVFLTWDFGRLVLNTKDLAEQDARASQQLLKLEQDHARLEQIKQDVASDAYAERIARETWHWTRENETLFVPLATPAATPVTPAEAAPPTPAPKPFWQDWLDRLYEPSP